MPSQTNHLLLRGSTWHVRIDIPAELRPAFGNRSILSKSLRTGDKRLAQELASTQVGQWKAEFRAIRDAKIRAGDRWREELHTTAKAHHEKADGVLLATIKGTLKATRSPARTLEELEANAANLANMEAELNTDLEQLGQELGLSGLQSEWRAIYDDESLPLVEKVKRASELQQKVLAHSAKARHTLNGSELSEALSLASDPASYRPKSPISATSIERFSEFYLTQNDNVRTRDVYVSKVQKLSKWLTTNGRELNFDAVAEFLDQTSQNRQTRTGYIAAWQRFHEWACRYDTYYRGIYADAKNPFDNHTHPRVGENAGGNWADYTQKEVEQLHAAALAKGDTDLADLIAFGAYTGCRIEELGRIRRETTILDESGLPIAFKVDKAKTPAGIREVPIHSALLPLYQKRLASPQGDEGFLFPGNSDTKHELRLSALGQRFSKLKRAEQFGDRHVFHSFRGTAATMLLRAGVSPIVIPATIGHLVGHITFDVYGKGPSLEQKREAIEKLQFNFQDMPNRKNTQESD
ncbi:tyrosine-type recombinase/integrase [Pseudomonas sp. JM0905a]|uniref:DUF6538 domain-containing protein n=1 Tax=Pseudomonas sp. JM0905a TaxID=2772484 RepID=UPI0016886D7E|nr:DUF6538 domain-containing protein [Pseudomonas sp. JM0905a]MBD2835974.1 tyrosine-type recombinase/integrase [Pseudomonas sp. JM0905a]